jgi:diguanylate cyclase (GGDEF)-like protein
MGPYPFIISMMILVVLTAVLVVGYRRYREVLARESNQNRMKQQQIGSLTVELKNLRKEYSRKSEIADQIPCIAKKMTEKLPLDAYPAIAVRSFKEFFHARQVGYFALVEGSSDYTLVVGAGFPPDWPGTVKVHVDEGILGMALQKKIVVLRTDDLPSAGQRSSHPSLENMGVSPDFIAPVFGVSGTVGALVVAGCPLPLEDERIHVSMLADLLSVALQNATHLDPSKDGKWVDQLTGVANRLYFQQRFESEIRRTENYRHALALLMFDIDEFKKINDTHGHHAGDVVIKKMAELVKNNTRSSDLVGRYGGDEFMVLIASTTEEQAASFAEHIRQKISTTDIAIPGTEVPVRITISGGIAILPANGQSTTELFQAADAALYESKRQGRNRILLATNVGLGGVIAKDADADREPPTSTDIPVDTGSDAVEISLGELGGNLNVRPGPHDAT